RVFQRKAKRLVGHAAQAQPGHLRANLWTSARRPRECASRIRKCSPLARTRHLAFLGRAHHHSRLDHPDRLLAEQNREFDRDHVRLSRPDAGQSSWHARPGLQRTVAARSGRKRHLARRRLPPRAKPCHARVERRPGFPRTGPQRSGNRWTRPPRENRACLRSEAATEEYRQDFRARLSEKRRPESAEQKNPEKWGCS